MYTEIYTGILLIKRQTSFKMNPFAQMEILKDNNYL